MKEILHKLAHYFCVNYATEWWDNENKHWVFKCKTCGKFD